MKKLFIFCLSLMFSSAVFAAEQNKITLTDGTVLKGEVVSASNATYTIEGAAFGRLKIPEEKIVRIEPIKYTSAITGMPLSTADQPQASEVVAYSQTMMRDPKNAAIANELTKDPVLQEMAKDPELLAAAQKGDVQALMQNPKFMEMVNSPEVQEAVKKMKK